MRDVVSVLVIGAMLAIGCVSAYAQETGRPFSEALDPTGKILPGANIGSFDASGYQMQLAPDGSPTFKSSPLDSNWDNRFWLPGVDNYVNAIAVDSVGNLYIGGSFTAINGNPAMKHIAKWDGTNWSALGSGLNDWVVTITISGSNVYAGGGFNTAGGVSASRIAK